MQVFSRSIIRKSYEFGKERVHISTDPIGGESIPLFRCDRCDRVLPQDQFGLMARLPPVGSRVGKYARFPSALHPECFLCRRQKRGVWAESDLYSPALDRFCTLLTSASRSGSHPRGILFALDKNDVLGMFIEQRGICAITGLEMDWKSGGRSNRNGRNYKAPSIDRIDSAGNYVLGNVHMVMQIANIMKNDLPMESFIAMCRQIADHNLSI